MAKVKGVDIYVEVNTGTEQTPVWTKLGGATDASISFSADTVDVTDKDSGGWAERLAGINSCEISSENFIIETDIGFGAIETAYLGKSPVFLRFVVGAGTKYSGSFLVTKLDIKGPLKEAGTVSLSFSSAGEIQKVTS